VLLRVRRLAATNPSPATTRPISSNRASTITARQRRYRRRRRSSVSTSVTGGSVVTAATSSSLRLRSLRGELAPSLREGVGRGLRQRNRRQVQGRTGGIDRHQLVDHGVAAGEAGELVTAHRILRSVEQALVAVG